MEYTKTEKQVIRELVKQIDPRLKVSFKEHDFQANVYNNTIFVGTRVSTEFMYWFRQEFPQCKNINWWLIHLLHEIGHCQVHTKKGQQERLFQVASLELDFWCISNPTQEQIEKYNLEYFKLPNEYSATSWGVNYYLRNKDKLNEIAEMLNY